MKIIIHSMSELYELAAAIYGAKAPERVVGLPTALAAPFVAEPAVFVREEAPHEPESAAVPAVTERTDDPPEFDSAGLPWDERIHAPSKATNKDGTWRARRGIDPAIVIAVEAELRAKLAGHQMADEPSDEPVATETHALPQAQAEADEQKAATDSSNRDASMTGAAAQDATPRYTSEELAEHVLVCQEHAAGQSDSHVELLTNCKGFIELYGHAAFNELKAAVAPVEGSPSGKSLQQFDPSERRLMQACMASY